MDILLSNWVIPVAPTITIFRNLTTTNLNTADIGIHLEDLHEDPRRTSALDQGDRWSQLFDDVGPEGV